ncbi:hypothetical protein ACUIAK_14740 [Bacillus cytotoxicus]
MLKSLDTIEIEKKLFIQRESLEKQITRFNKRQRNLKEMRMDGEITKSEFYEMREENEEQIKQVKQQMELIDVKLENLSNMDEEQARLQDAIKKVR